VGLILHVYGAAHMGPRWSPVTLPIWVPYGQPIWDNDVVKYII